MIVHEPLKEYLNSLKEAIAELDLNALERIVDTLLEAQVNARQIFLFGNGGSAITASHFTCDLAKTAAVPGKPPLRAICLTDNIALITAIANDISYNDIFVEQMSMLWNDGDLAIGISASGNSPNVIKAMEYANDHSGRTIGICGFGGGKLAKIVDLHITFSSYNYGVVEDMHLIINHLISQAFQQRLQSEGIEME